MQHIEFIHLHIYDLHLVVFLGFKSNHLSFYLSNQKIKSLTLTKENEPLNWQADDEIGF